MFSEAGKNVQSCNTCNGENWQHFCQQVTFNVALDNCTAGDDAKAAEEVTRISSVENIFEEGLSGDNVTPEYKEDQCQQ